eukprot:scaffold4649_cov72-Cyclotella_meneghiniana.AAC.21
MKSLRKEHQKKPKVEQFGITSIKKVTDVPICKCNYVGAEVDFLNARDDESNTRDGADGHRDTGIEDWGGADRCKDGTEEVRNNDIDQIKSATNTPTNHKRNRVGIRGKVNKIISIMRVRGLKKKASSREFTKESATCRNHIVKLLLQTSNMALLCGWILIQAYTFISPHIHLAQLLATFNTKLILVICEGSMDTQTIAGNHNETKENHNLRDTSHIQNATQISPKQHNPVENNYDEKELQSDDMKTLQVRCSNKKMRACSDVADEVIVTECGVAEVNGTYRRNGYSCNAPKYSKLGRWKGQEIEIQIYRVLSKDWYICIMSKYIRFFHAKSYGSLPPVDGWKVLDGGVEPSPMISIIP